MADLFHFRSYFFLLFFFNFHLISGGNHRWEYDGVVVARSDYQSLLSIKRDLVDSRGFLKSWTTTGATNPCSAWAGIKCVNGRVIAIQLPWKGLGGRISDRIGDLKSLRRLSLHDNLLAGPVPASLGLLPNLRGVYLFNNRLSGAVPPSIGNCLFLQTLDLSSNQLTGIVPPSLANSTVLYRLNLSFNGLSGPIPVPLSRSYSLTFLDLRNNNLSGSVPDGWGSGLSVNGSSSSSYKLRSLGLGHNFLSGKIPVSLSNLTMLEELNLSHNNLEGSIPDELGSMSRLSSIDLSRNNLTGKIPVSIADSLRNLSSFNVSYNNLSGLVPSALSEKFNSTSFVGNIQLCGYNGSSPCQDNSTNSSSDNNDDITSPPQGGTNHHRRKLSTKDIILMAAGCLLFVLLILCCVLLCFLIRKRAASKGKKGHSASPGGGGGAKAVAVESGGAENGGKLVHFDGPFVFTADDLLCATAETMGKTAYGTAYKATLEESHNTVAVKRLREKIMKVQKEFELEVSVLGKIRHDNILALRAYYLGPKGEKLLVYDYMTNGSLASFLHARGPETSVPWSTRKTIAMGIARGLCFLHSAEQNIVHGNLTSSNILLDEQNNPKIAEVGLSRLTTTTASTHLIATAGTTGYRAPELSKQKNATTFSTKAASDVYSLGVIMLELLTGKSPGETKEDGLDLAQWVASTVKDERTNLVFDVELVRGAAGSSSEGGGDDELVDVLKLALHCVDPSPSARPEARQVLQKLEEMKPDVATGPVSGDGDGAAAAIV